MLKRFFFIQRHNQSKWFLVIFDKNPFGHLEIISSLFSKCSAVMTRPLTWFLPAGLNFNVYNNLTNENKV